jgi:hypothetical protein
VVVGMATASEYSQKAGERQQQQLPVKEGPGAASKATSTSAQRSVRSTVPWAPAPLLCKRMNVKLPDLSQSAVPVPSRAEAARDALAQALGTAVALPVAGFGKGGAAAEVPEVGVTEEEAAKQDVYQSDATVKPALSVFKSIFEDTDSEEDEPDEREHDAAINESDDVEQLSTALEGSGQPEPRPQPQGNAQQEQSRVDDAVLEDTGVVRFVPSKLRATTKATNGAGQPSSGKSNGQRTVRRSFSEVDDDATPEETANAVAAAKFIRTLDRGLDGADDEGAPGLIPAVGRRATPQSVAGIGGSKGPSGRAGRGVGSAAAGTLRQRLLLQQREDDDSDADVAIARPHAAATAARPQPAEGAVVARADLEESSVPPPPATQAPSKQEGPPERVPVIDVQVSDTAATSETSELRSSRWATSTTGPGAPPVVDTLRPPAPSIPPPPPREVPTAERPAAPVPYTGPPLSSAISKLQFSLESGAQGTSHKERKHHKSHKESKHKHKKDKAKHKSDRKKERKSKSHKKSKSSSRKDAAGEGSSGSDSGSSGSSSESD